MKTVRRARLSLEHLEHRVCPSLTIQQTSTALIISGTPTVATAPLAITEVGGANNNLFQITEGTTNLGTFRISSGLTVNLNSRPNDLDLDLNGGFIPGNVQLSLGNGYVGNDPIDAAVNVSSGTTTPVAGGTIRGSLTILGGNGQEGLDVGGFVNALAMPQVARTPTPITIQGNLVAATRAGNIGIGDLLLIGAGTRVGGAVQATQVDVVNVGEENTPATTTIGSLSVVTSGTSTGTSVEIVGVVNGSVTVNAAASTSSFNNFTLEPQTGAIGASIGQNLSVFLGNAAQGNEFFLDANTTVGGSATLTNSSPATDIFATAFDIEGTINGSATLNLGSGHNDITSDTGVIFGNLTINGGNGNNTISGFFALAFQATISGNLTVNLGNGSNFAVIATAPGGLFRWTSGNGQNFLFLDPDDGAVTPGPSQVWNVNFHFGSDDDVLALVDSTNPQVLTGFVDMGGSVTGNQFFQGMNWSLSSPFQLQNVP